MKEFPRYPTTQYACNHHLDVRHTGVKRVPCRAREEQQAAREVCVSYMGASRRHYASRTQQCIHITMFKSMEQMTRGHLGSGAYYHKWSYKRRAGQCVHTRQVGTCRTCKDVLARGTYYHRVYCVQLTRLRRAICYRYRSFAMRMRCYVRDQ